MSHYKKLQTTRDVILHFREHFRGRVLDVGAGTAKYKSLILREARQYVAFDAEAGADIDVKGNVEKLPFPEASFDTVLCNQVLEHVPHPWIVVKEIARVAKPGGAVIITAPFFAAFHKDPEDYFRYTVDGLSQLCTDAGLQIIQRDCYTPVFSTLFQMIEFTCASPYAADRSAGRWTQRFVRYGLKLAGIFDRFAKRHIIYGNSYVVAQKP